MASGKMTMCARESAVAMRLQAGPSRRGAALVFVVGILALIAVILLVFAATGIGDSRSADNASRIVSAEDQSTAVAGYMQQVVGDSVFATVRQRQVLSHNRPAEAQRGGGFNPSTSLNDPVLNLSEMTDKVFRRTWTAPGVDPELISQDTTGGLLAHRQFNPTGSISTPWTTRLPLKLNDNTGRLEFTAELIGNGVYRPTSSAVDPRTGSDPWLASAEPSLLNRSRASLDGNFGSEFGIRTSPIDDLRDRSKQRTDWLSLSNFAPDGRAVNLANLRGNFDVPSGVGPGTISGYLTLMIDRGRQGSDDPVAGILPDLRISRTGDPTDGIYTSRLLPLFGQTSDSLPLNSVTIGTQTLPMRVDLASDNVPAHWFANQLGVYRPVGDTRFAPGDPRNLDNQFRDTDGDGFYDARLFELVDVSIGFARPVVSAAANMRLFVAARAIDLSGLVNVNTALSFAQMPIGQSPLLNTIRDDQNIPTLPSAMAGSTPGDVDLERLLSMRGIFDGRGVAGTNREVTLYGFFAQPATGLPTNYNGFERIVDSPSGRRNADEVGGSAFTSLLFTRLYGERPALGQTFVRTIAGEAISANASGIARSSTDSRYDAVFGRPQSEGGRLGAAERARMSRLTRADRGLGATFREDLPGAAGTPDDMVFALSGRFGLSDELELRSFQGLNRAGSTSSLEQVLDGRSFDTDRATWGPMRSNRPLSLELAANVNVNNNDALIGAPFSADKADWATGLLRSQVSVRSLITTVSAQRPLISDPSRPLLSVNVGAFDQLTSTAQSRAAENRRLAAALATPLSDADLPTALEPIVSAMSALPGRVRTAQLNSWRQGTPYNASTPIERLPVANFEQSISAAMLFRGYLDSLAPDLSDHPALWESGANRGGGQSGRPRTRSLSFGERSISEIRAQVPEQGFSVVNGINDNNGSDYDRNLVERQTPNRTDVVMQGYRNALHEPWLGSTAELSARVSAHLAVNFMDMNDVSDRPSAFTLVLDPELKGRPDPFWAATGTQTQNYGLRATGGNADPVSATASLPDLRDFNNDTPSLPDAVGYLLPNNGANAFGSWVRTGSVGVEAGIDASDRSDHPTLNATADLLGRLPDYRIRGIFDVDAELPGDRRPGQTGELPTRMARDYDSSRDGALPDRIDPANGAPNATRRSPLERSSTPPMINVFGVKPQPFITAAVTLVLYADAWNLEFRAAPQPGSNDSGLTQRLPMINGEKRNGNADFITEVVAFQLHNPFDRAISLSIGSPVIPKPSDQTFSTADAYDDALETWRRFHGRIDHARSDDRELRPEEQRALQYYIEFAGRYYGVAEMVRDSGNDISQARLYPVMLQPGETRFFYAMSRDPEDAVKRMIYATRSAANTGTAITPSQTQIDYFYHWINRQLGIENTVTVNDGTAVQPRFRTEKRFLAPVRLAPMNPQTFDVVIPHRQPTQDNLTALPPNIVRAGISALTGALPVTWSGQSRDASDTEVRLWRTIIDEDENARQPSNRNDLINDLLVDRLRQPLGEKLRSDPQENNNNPPLEFFADLRRDVYGVPREFPRLAVGFEPRVRSSDFIASNEQSGPLTPGATMMAAGMLAQPADTAPPTRVDLAPDELDITSRAKPSSATGNGYATVLYAAILRPGMKYDFPRDYTVNPADSDDLAVPTGVLPPWLIEAKSAALSRNEVFDSFDRLAIRRDQQARAAFSFDLADGRITLVIPAELKVPNGTDLGLKPSSAGRYKFILRHFLDREPNRTPSDGRTTETGLSGTDLQQATALTYLHFTKPYMGPDRFSSLLRLTMGQPTSALRTLPGTLQDGFSNAQRPVFGGRFRPSYWPIDSNRVLTPAIPRPGSADGEPTDVQDKFYIGAFARDILYPPAQRLRNPIDPPELTAFPEDKLYFSSRHWPFMRTDATGSADGLTPRPRWQMANNNVISSGTLSDASKRFARGDRSAPNLSGLYYRAIVDQLPPTFKMAHRLSDAAIEAGETNPQLRLTDLLLAWAVGPYEVPLRWANRDLDLRDRAGSSQIVAVTNLDERFTTLSESIALALDYDAPINYRFSASDSRAPIFDRKDAMFRIGQMVSSAPAAPRATPEDNNPNARNLAAGLPAVVAANAQPRNVGTLGLSTLSRYYPIRGLVLDGGRLSLTAPAPFSDPDGSTRYELSRDNPHSQHGAGVPLALNILSRFRLTSQGGIASGSIGKININTAPKAVLSVLPLVTLDPLKSLPPTSRTTPSELGDTAGWQNASVLSMQLANPLLGARGASASNQRERFLTRLIDAPTRVDVDPDLGIADDVRIDDLAAALVSYRDKVPQFVLPRFTNATRTGTLTVDFSDSNFAPVDRRGFGGMYDSKGRAMATGNLTMREGRGVQSFGELMAVRIGDRAPVAFTGPIGSAERQRFDPPAFPQPEDAPALAASKGINRFQLRTAGMDRYARQEMALRNSGLLTELHRDADEADPFPQVPFAQNRDLFENGLQVSAINGTISAGLNDVPVPADQAQLLPTKAAANYESRLAVLAALSETATVRSDTFCIWFTVEGYTPEDVAGTFGLPLFGDGTSNGDLGGFNNSLLARTVTPTLKRRYVMILDRSNVIRPGDKPKVLSLQELPFDARSVAE